MRIILDHTQAVNDHVTSFWFKPEQPMHFIAGQFIELTLPHDQPDDRGTRRWFTISSSPTDPLISITAKLGPEHSSSFKRALRQLQPGAELTAIDAMGDFVLPLDPATPLLFVVGGMGITPLHSIARWLRATRQTRHIQLLYGASVPEDLLFVDELRTAGIDATLFVGQPPAGWPGETGRVSAEYVLRTVKPSAGTLVYISGPEGMVGDIKHGLIVGGVDRQHIVTDSFPGYSHE